MSFCIFFCRRHFPEAPGSVTVSSSRHWTDRDRSHLWPVCGFSTQPRPQVSPSKLSGLTMSRKMKQEVTMWSRNPAWKILKSCCTWLLIFVAIDSFNDSSSLGLWERRVQLLRRKFAVCCAVGTSLPEASGSCKVTHWSEPTSHWFCIFVLWIS